jgi:hypothetical protein
MRIFGCICVALGLILFAVSLILIERLQLVVLGWWMIAAIAFVLGLLAILIGTALNLRRVSSKYPPAIASESVAPSTDAQSLTAQSLTAHFPAANTELAAARTQHYLIQFTISALMIVAFLVVLRHSIWPDSSDVRRYPLLSLFYILPLGFAWFGWTLYSVVRGLPKAPPIATDIS